MIDPVYEYDDAVLLALAKDSDSAGWYKIEIRLSNMDVVTREYLPARLKVLAEKGLIEKDPLDEGKYRLTLVGMARVQQIRGGGTS